MLMEIWQELLCILSFDFGSDCCENWSFNAYFSGSLLDILWGTECLEKFDRSIDTCHGIRNPISPWHFSFYTSGHFHANLKSSFSDKIFCQFSNFALPRLIIMRKLEWHDWNNNNADKRAFTLTSDCIAVEIKYNVNIWSEFASNLHCQVHPRSFTFCSSNNHLFI